MINFTDQKLYNKDDCFLNYDTYLYFFFYRDKFVLKSHRLKKENGGSDEGKDIEQIEIVLNNHANVI